MLRTASSLPPKGLSTLGSGPARFQTRPPACYRASWQLPGPDFHRQATTSLRTRRHTMAYVTASPPVPLGARKRLTRYCRDGQTRSRTTASAARAGPRPAWALAGPECGAGRQPAGACTVIAMAVLMTVTRDRICRLTFAYPLIRSGTSAAQRRPRALQGRTPAGVFAAGEAAANA